MSSTSAKRVKPIIEPFVYEWTSRYGGSVSAEHGVGTLKSDYLHLSKSEAAITMMANTKAMMDPRCILNPNKVIPAKYILKAFENSDM